MLLHLLVHSVTFLTSLTPELEMAILCQSCHSSHNMACHGDLGIRHGSTIQRAFR